MNATKKMLIVDSVYCVAKSLLVVLIAMVPSSHPVVRGVFGPLVKYTWTAGLVPYLWGVPLVLAAVTAVFAWKAGGVRWKGLLAAMIAWIGLVTVLETIYLLDFLFGWTQQLPT